MTGAAIPVREVDGEPVHGPGRGQCARADRLRRRALRGGHHRLHDAAATARPASSSTAPTACCRCSATTGRPRATSCGATTPRAWELHPESDPTWPWTDGLRHLVECLETGAEPVTRPEHAYHALEIMLAAQAAGADGRAREIASDFPAPDLARLGGPARPRARARPAERVVSLVERMPPPGVLAAAGVRRPGADPARRRHPPRVGRARLGRGVRLDLRVDRARAHARVRARAGRRVPPLGGLPHDLRGRRGPARARRARS